jgi:outer membrane lipoprotein SlyB
MRTETIRFSLLIALLALAALALAGCSDSPPPAEETGIEEAAEPTAGEEPAEEAPEAEAPPEPAAPAAAPEEPEPEPEPEPLIVTVPEGTELGVMFLDGVSSAASQAGDTFRVRITEDIIQDEVPAIPAGSVITGTVLEAVSLKKIGGKAKLALEFNRLELPSGRTALIDASFATEGKSETKKDAATIGGAAAGGALLGRIVKKKDKGKGALIGAIVGAAAGTAIAAKTEGEEVELPAGTELDLVLNQPATITVRP